MDNKTIKDWFLVLIFLTVPIFNIFYFLYLLTRKDEIGTYAKASLFYLITISIIIAGGIYYLVKQQPQAVQNMKHMLSDYIMEDDNQEKIITYEGQSPNSLDVSQSATEERYYGDENVGYLQLTGNYNVYPIETNEGLLAGIKIASETETYTIYRYSSKDKGKIEEGLKNAYTEKQDKVVIMQNVSVQGALADIVTNIDRITTTQGYTGYVFVYNGNTFYLVGTGSDEVEWNLGTYTPNIP